MVEKYKICPNPKCGKHNKPKAIECLWCETDLSGVKPTDDETEAAKALAEQQRADNSIENRFVAPINHAGKMIRVCEGCGTHNAANARKCTNCGEDISDVTPSIETFNDEGTSHNIVYQLVSLDGEIRFDILQQLVTIGRESELKDYLKNKSYVSRKHAEIFYIDGDLYIKNLSKTNYTYVNNDKLDVDEQRKLNDGDELGIGGNVSNGQRQDMAAYFTVKLG